MARYNNLIRSIIFLYLGTLPSTFAAQTDISAAIADDIGCEIRVPVSLIFTPQRTSAFQGAPAAYEIKPLRAALECAGKTRELVPKLSIEGNTPYETDTVFLNGEPNGVGFMLRLSDGSSPSLSDFYSPEKAIKRGIALPLSPLNIANQHHTEEVFWVGLVGPVQDNVLPGQFFSTLTFNFLFQ
ncbi:fimbrial protein [uncultured Cedecea sp.]|uniref:fimbrial protein n=1 Tax=uncultured Cedecea sp. TaxID=988762 RepID=UPI00261DD752|nr:fimbrial protein [uncultured Cedecea sp.]